ncbi:tripartite tricarboxylate transporter TctB family protein [Labrenzia sp. PO1]|jgi:putative tricarboxylic transport membrane protein|uniref:tripartite tricarboxylate transporter TctB family protein n=1 Tax=Stappiaceae TaxID=2821832 RepID=UPI0003B88C35|nr:MULTISPECIES: tripartite tricarboxylate transporter TctB family protein [Stappiaceae]MCR9281272.1 tripartite tricarboxylate transporter TctB family protein [Paracoccaceae bacterium]MEC9405213.1 tripartite tricarboxylate transporter TctB family protein [Pseudomonadota bacterium]ERP86333.1 membrane protein [Labrenzia sp. C1B10]ERS06657.1 membrane protein [Labrenzia sp. C1B70]MBO9460337.1 tripartite tricarboxylate transporter TctB family protein [Labrenzia sp. R5_0]
MSDRIFGAVGLLLALGYAWAALVIEESFLSDAVGPKAFPLIIASVLGLSSLAIFLKPDVAPEWPSLPRLLEVAMAVLAMILYAILLPEAGFIIATAIAAAYLTWRLGSSPIGSLITGCLTSLGIYAVFHLVLGLSLAKGPFGF